MVVRNFHPGMGQAVAERTILRKINGEYETWENVAKRVALGNTLLCSPKEDRQKEYDSMVQHLSKVTLLMSGRHLQHGDETQPSRTMEIFTNCSSSSTSFMLFLLLMSGSGVGRCYDDDVMLVNWDNAPNLRCVLDEKHPDFDHVAHESVREAKHKYHGKDVMWFLVPDTREGWAKAVEIYENAAFEKIHKDKILVLDFSAVRPKGTPIHGMQDRPASGPIPLMNAFSKVASLKGSVLEPWHQAMYVDHYFAECVLVGGARRSARMSVKNWRDKNVLTFIQIKRPIEFLGKNINEIQKIRAQFSPMGFLWSSNNSVLVDEEFWELVRGPRGASDLAKHAHDVFDLLTQAAYGDGTGEPGIINQDKLVQNNEGFSKLLKSDIFGSSKYQIEDETHLYINRLAKKVSKRKYYTIVNPCSEISFNMLGAFCVIADTVPFFADTLDEAEEAFRLATRALIRVNTMDSIYKKEVQRTNRIGVAITGIHEFAWKFFGYNFYDLIDEKKSLDFWMTLARFNCAVREESAQYCELHGLPWPHTLTAVKPSGCRPWHSLTSTKNGLLTLEELLKDHVCGEQWSDYRDVNFVKQGVKTNRIKKTYCNGKSELVRVTMNYGLCVESTPNHPWFVKHRVVNKERIPVNEWIEAKNLRANDVLEVELGSYTNDAPHEFTELKPLCVRMREDHVRITQPKYINEDLSWFLGYLWGAGAMSSSKFRIRFTDSYIPNLEKAKSILKKEFGIESEYILQNGRKCYALDVGSKELWHWLIRNGVYKYFADKIDLIPECVRCSTPEHIAAFFAGMLDSNGCVGCSGNQKTLMITHQDPLFSRHLQDVGWAIGLGFGFSHNTAGKNFQRKKNMHLLCLSKHVLPHIFEALRRNSNKMVAHDEQHPNKRWHQEVGNNTGREIGKIVCVEYIDADETYDIEVENEHWYYAGAVKSHNTVSKLWGLTEGWHLPAMAWYLRWVQFNESDPLVQTYIQAGYPHRYLKQYKNTVIIGFPTAPMIASLGLNRLVLASDATPEEQYKWIMLGEKYWIEGVQENGEPWEEKRGNSISYTLKYDPKVVDYVNFKKTILQYQSKVRCCAVMPQEDVSAYEYVPEQSITREEYEAYCTKIKEHIAEDIGKEHIDCSTGACPVDFKAEK